MNTDFQVVLISTDPYHQGLLEGYCHTHCFKLFEMTADKESIDAMIQMQPNIIFLAAGLTQDRKSKIDFGLIREMSINHHIPVCYLGGLNNDSGLEKELVRWVDTTLPSPLNVNQLEDYLRHKFKHHYRFIQDKRSRARRAANDRRALLLEQQNTIICKTHSTNNTEPNSDSYYFTVGPFLIDRRSKCVLFNEKSLHLTRKEFELFELLAQDVDRVFMTDEIINHVWPENNRVTKSDLYQYMHLLRKKIEIDPNNPQWLLTVKGFGYKLNVLASTAMSPPGKARLCENTLLQSP